MSDHPECGLLDEYVLGTLDRRDALRVTEHLKTCAACRCECDELRSVVDVLPLALAPSAAPSALRDRILAASDVPPSRFSAVAVARGLAAALLIALTGDVFLGLRLGAGRTAVAVATPTAVAAPAATPVATPLSGAAVPEAHATARPASGHVSPRSSSATSSAPARATAAARAAAVARQRAADDAATIARLKHELALVQQRSRVDRRLVRVLEGELARAQALPRVVAVAPTSIPVATSTPAPAPSPPDDALVSTLRSGKVYAIDGAVGGEPWHLTILQPREGERAVIYSGTPDAPSGQTYRTWVLRDGRTVNVGELVPGKPATLEMPMALEPGDVVAFSREPIGTGDLPTQPFLMQLKIGQ